MEDAMNFGIKAISVVIAAVLVIYFLLNWTKNAYDDGVSESVNAIKSVPFENILNAIEEDQSDEEAHGR